MTSTFDWLLPSRRCGLTKSCVRIGRPSPPCEKEPKGVPVPHVLTVPDFVTTSVRSLDAPGCEPPASSRRLATGLYRLNSLTAYQMGIPHPGKNLALERALPQRRTAIFNQHTSIWKVWVGSTTVSH